VAVDQKTDTVYVTDFGDNAVSVFNGATCNALDTSGCGQRPATVPVGPQPQSIFADQANHTVYIANTDNGLGATTTVSMLDSATCNATDLAGCPAAQPHSRTAAQPHSRPPSTSAQCQKASPWTRPPTPST
jgi:hypothetical protein